MMRLRADAMLAALAFATLAMPATAADRALVLEIDGAIGPPIADYVVQELQAAKPATAGLIILRMNTPGGLDSSMRQIVSAILASPVPVATYVAPNGARAASAGTYIAYASAIAAMAPGTNIGAATPVQLGGIPLLPADQKEQKQQGKNGEPADTETRKIVNDAVAYIRSLAALNGRNADWAAEAVRSAASLPASEALTLHVIDVIADDNADLLRQDRWTYGDRSRKTATSANRRAQARDRAAGLAHRSAQAGHRSERRLPPHADRRLWPHSRIL